jgi:molecular chaperone DnaJ
MVTKRQEQLLRDFEADGGETSPKSEGFFARVKEFWEDLTE